jgi:deoxyribodipyrimidine photo-lyase
MMTNIYWFRQDLRLGDSPALLRACKDAQQLILVYVHPVRLQEDTLWGFPRTSKRRAAHLQATLQELRESIANRGNQLLEFVGEPAEVMKSLADTFNVECIYCEAIEAPEERADVAKIESRGIQVVSTWQSSMLDPTTLPFAPEAMPDIFTAFRQKIEQSGAHSRDPVAAPTYLPPAPSDLERVIDKNALRKKHVMTEIAGERSAYRAVSAYFSTTHPQHYKQTRNQLLGEHYSTRLSVWLASGALSAAVAYKCLKQHEAAHGSNDSTYWIFFELLWRDYFRFLHFKYGTKLYLKNGLKRAASTAASARHEPNNEQARLMAWVNAQTSNNFVNAGMTELRETGHLSNRMRQIVASYLIYDLEVDWRAGAAWFESQLLDFDVYSNQGNWLYIAGCGTDPRGGRRMNMQKQIQEHDPDSIYRKHWGYD